MATDPDQSKSPSAADHVVRHLHSISQALKGEANRLTGDDAAKPDYFLLDQAGSMVIHAHCVGLLEGVLDLKVTVPEAREFIAESASRLQTWRENTATVNTPEPSSGSDGKPPVTTSQDEETILWRQHVNRVQIEEMLQTISREGDPAEQLAADRSRLTQLVLARTWELFSELHPASLSPEAARIKHELLPGVDPWLGLPRDFIKAAWVCSFLAERIDDQFDVLTLSDAEKQSGIGRSVIWRACQPKSNGDVLIANNQKSKNALRLSRKALWKWIKEIYRPATTKEEGKKKVATPWEYICTSCDWSSDINSINKPEKCPKCTNHTIVRKDVSFKKGQKRLTK